MLKSLRTMSTTGIVAETPDGWLVVNFAKRQAPAGGAERMRQFRERSKALSSDVTERHIECDAAAADPSSSASDSVSESDSEDGAERVRQSRERRKILKEDVTKRYRKCNAAAADLSSSASESISSSDSESDSEDSTERVRQSRERRKILKEDVTKRYRKCNAAAAHLSSSASASVSLSASDSISESESDSGEGVQGEGPPRAPAEVLAHPDKTLYASVGLAMLA